MRTFMIGGGMIAHDQILPSLYQLKRLGRIEGIDICDRRKESLEALASAPLLRQAFPDQGFTPRTEPYAEGMKSLPARQLAVVAVPDALHYEAVMCALRADQHVLCVKPLVLTVAQAEEIEQEARGRGLLVGVEYHKRFDDRSLMARRRYQAGLDM